MTDSRYHDDVARSGCIEGVEAPEHPPTELLSEDEFEALDHLVKFVKASSKFIRNENDVREVVDKVHQLQSLVMSQAAARAYPDKFRLLT